MIKPEINMLATVCVGSDRYAAKVIRISKTGKTIWIAYDYKPSVTAKATYRRGQWREHGDGYGKVIVLGQAVDYRDPSF